MKSSQRFLCHRTWFIWGAAVAVYISSALLVCAQSLSSCNTVMVNPNGEQVGQTNCIQEWYSGGTPQITATVEVGGDYDGYLAAVDAIVRLYDTSGILAQQDANPVPYGPSTDESASVTVAMTPGDLYDVQGDYSYCYDSTGNGGYGQPPFENDWMCSGWTGGGGPYNLGTNFFEPGVQVISVLYPPPGDLSTTGYTNATTNGTTTSVGSSFSQSNGISFSGGTDFPAFNGGGSIGFSHATTSGNTTAFQTTLTDMTGVTEEANTRAQYNPNHLDMPNHLWDSFVLLLNPQVTTASDDSNNLQGYSVDIQPIAGDGWTAQADLSEVVAEDMINGTVYPDTLNPTLLPIVNGTQFSMPGLAAICQNRITTEYNSNSCTLTDQCGCQKSDFSSVLGQDGAAALESQHTHRQPHVRI